MKPLSPLSNADWLLIDCDYASENSEYNLLTLVKKTSSCKYSPITKQIYYAYLKKQFTNLPSAWTFALNKKECIKMHTSIPCECHISKDI